MRKVWLHVIAIYAVLVYLTWPELPMSEQRLEFEGPVALTWDAPAELSHYRIYYRQRGDPDWVHHGDAAPSATPRYDVDLAPGEWEFAIRWVDIHGRESELHTSLDETAAIDDEQKGGWFLDLRAASQ